MFKVESCITRLLYLFRLFAFYCFPVSVYLELDVLSRPALFQRGFNGPGLALGEISKVVMEVPDAKLRGMRIP